MWQLSAWNGWLLLLLGADLDKFNLVKLKTLTQAADTGVSAANKIGNLLFLFIKCVRRVACKKVQPVALSAKDRNVDGQG